MALTRDPPYRAQARGRMTGHRPLPHEALRRLKRPLALTRIGMVAERFFHAFWQFATVLLASLAVVMFGGLEFLPIEGAWAVLVLAVGGLGFGLWRGVRGFHWPTAGEALGRLDATLPGRPITAITDAQAIGAGDADSVTVWRAHVQRMADRAGLARPLRPDLRLARRDPYALRYAALLAFFAALIFGSIWRVADVADMAPGASAQNLAAGPVWEGWVEPPAYTRRPSLYLNDIRPGTLEVPQGSRISIRLYGEVGALSVAESVSGTAGEASSEPAQEITVTRDGTLSIAGEGGAEWQLSVLADLPPVVSLAGPAERGADGTLEQPFAASDDYGVISGTAEITLDMPEIDRRHGLAPEPEPREVITVDLPTDFTGDGSDFSEVLVAEFAEHAWAGLPVRLNLTVNDASGQMGETAPQPLTLPQRRFFDPMAATVAEQRRDLLWTRHNAPRVAQILRAVSYHPEDIFRSETAYLRMRVIIRRLEGYSAGGLISGEQQDEIAAALWDLALMLEEGDLNNAQERLRRAQERLSEAIENGATDEEIAALMQELREAMQDYMRQLAEQQQDQQQMAEGPQQEITGQQLEDMLQRLQELMEQGRMAEAQQLLNQLMQMMQNMQIAQGQGQQGQSPGEQAMEGLAETLRQQQELSDETFGDLQEQFGQGQPGEQQGQQPGQPGQGQQGQQGQGQGQQPGGGDLGQSLADRQQALRDELSRQQDSLPGAGTPEGDAAQEALDRAGRAMDGAEEALRDEDYAGALDQQSEALEALREGMRNLGEAMAQQQQNGQGQPGEGMNGLAEGQALDPLGRAMGEQGRIGTDEQLLQGEDVYRRARELLDELRRRSGEQDRPDAELDYLRRLLERF